jgi:NAD(P)-dependent dehydrogenase (short-subunit alcohol dehydrogenase family)
LKQNNYQGALQKPTGSGFNAASTAHDVIQGIDLTGKTAIVTGGYAGIGLETTKALISAGATVIVPVRDKQKAEKNLAGIAVEIETMDLMDPASIDLFAEKFLASGRPLHLLINNAGIMWVPLQRDARGYESQLSTNHLGHFQLTARLWPALKKANGARVVNVSSWGHHLSPFLFDDPNFNNREYDSMVGYGQSKTANILFAIELDKRGQEHGVRAYSLHPGSIVETDLKRHIADDSFLIQIGIYDENKNPIHDVSKGQKTIPQGASTTVWCATSPKLQHIGGVYCDDTEIASIDIHWTGIPDLNNLTKGVTAYALDPEAAQRLWTISEELINLKFSI